MSAPSSASAPSPAPERDIARAIARRALAAAAPWLLVAGLVWGVDGAASAAYGLALVVLNLLAAAALITHSARISPTAVMVAVLAGFVVRLGLLTLAVLAVSGLSLFEPVPLAATIVVGHLGLLVWESRRVVASSAPDGHNAPVRRRRGDDQNRETK
ncbi:MAG TPA: ATP synthase subunit I [Acidimicrobiaceae bacterium]|nr:ATP synthase subunit I [Acidimicrobiaceae bacterium]HCB37404.1 ATP synthase subunit I [Acidimicrobiaceae bacterium]